MSNLRFPKVFVLTAANKWVTNKLSTALTLGEVGLIEVNSQQVAVAGAGPAPAPATKPRLKFAQNVGDSSYGTVQSKVISVANVKDWRGKAATAAVGQTTYIGYDEIVGTKDISVVCGKELLIPIQIYNKKLARWYGFGGANFSILVDTGCCPDCGSPCTAADKLYVANQIALQLNTGLQRAGDIPATSELGQYLTATVVTNGGVGDALRVGVKIVTKAYDNDDQQALSSCDPVKYWEFQTYNFTVGNVYDGFCSSTSIPVTTTVQANPGTGWAAAVAALEAESQGYDRVRDAVTAYPFSKKNNYKIFAVAGTKYDYYHLDFDWEHRTGGGIDPYIKEPYEIMLIIPTGLGATIETDINAWLAGRFPAVDITP
jgi:hypothetical protein